MVSRKRRDCILGRQKQQIVSHLAIKKNHKDKFWKGYLVVVGKENYVK